MNTINIGVICKNYRIFRMQLKNLKNGLHIGQTHIYGQHSFINEDLNVKYKYYLITEKTQRFGVLYDKVEIWDIVEKLHILLDEALLAMK